MGGEPRDGCGYKAAAISDVSGGKLCASGLNITTLAEYTKTPKGYLIAGHGAPGIEDIDNDALLGRPCDHLP